MPSQLGVLYELALLSSKRRFETLLDKKIEGVAITAPIIEGERLRTPQNFDLLT